MVLGEHGCLLANNIFQKSKIVSTALRSKKVVSLGKHVGLGSKCLVTSCLVENCILHFRFAEQDGEDIVIRARLPRVCYPNEVILGAVK